MSKSRRYLTAQEAAQELNITVATLYAYVSRGLIRSESGNGRNRARLYHSEDVARLRQRKQYRRNPDKVAEQALQAGSPILESAITLITDDCLYYRGQNALELAVQTGIEAVAELIWTGTLEKSASIQDTLVLSPRCQAIIPHLHDLKPIERMQAILPIAAADDLAAYNRHPQAVAQTGRRILQLMTLVATGQTEIEGDIAQTLQQSWVPQDTTAKILINAALILCADHELNASAFTARCAASTEANPYGVVIAGLAALQGHKHGTASEQVEIFFREMEAATSIRRGLVDRLKRGEQIPGYGHLIYRDVDPRASVLNQLMATHYPLHPAVKRTQEIVQEANQLVNMRQNVDFMLATLARVLQLPPGGAPALFALGRTIGWLGHAIEQYGLGQIIRPRAKYVGKLPPV
ncbi:MAG: citrate synthase family protein [Chloroflexota bacterium]